MKKFVLSRSSRVVLIPISMFALAGCGSSGGGGGGSDASVDTGSNVESEAGGSDATASDTGAGGGDGASSCGDSVVEPGEECDDGAQNGTTGDPCTIACQWVCIPGDPNMGDAVCNTSGNPCLGTATCIANHTCQAGTALGQGASCGNGKICNAGLCADAVCGDGIVTAPEECDDGSSNGTASDGCTKSCTFVCLSTDPARDCAPADSCAGNGTCNDTKHTCTAGTPLANGTSCSTAGGDAGADAGTGDVCVGGTCIVGYCGDGVVESTSADGGTGEQCDFGTGNGPGTGCELDCTFSCTKSPNSCPQPPDTCAGPSTCTTVTVTGDTGQKCVVGPPLANNTACGNGGKCTSGSCIGGSCGDGVIQTGEDCDWGTASNVAGSGCDPDCKFSCTKSPDSCTNNDLCAVSPMTCQTTASPDAGASDLGQKCQAATQLTNCGVCDTATSGNFVCASDKCAASVCGDGCVDPRNTVGTAPGGEQCDPPDGVKCDSKCQSIICGDKILEEGEDCDDGNLTNLDGCDHLCKFEQDHRANMISIDGTTMACAHNALGATALENNFLTLAFLNSQLATNVKSGLTTIAFKFMNVTDLTGQNANPGLQLGALSGAPVTGTAYDGTNDVDWWYTTSAETIDSSRNPTALLPATLSGEKLTATGTIDLFVAITGSTLNTLHVTGTTINASIGPSKPPTTSTGTTPGHTELIKAGLQSFQTMTNGTLCGNLSAASLATVAVPSLLVGTTCTPNYVATSSLLDLIENGCAGVLVNIKATQPDQIDPAAPVAGAGPVAGGSYALGSTGASVSTCTDKVGTVFTKPSDGFTKCLNAAAYSSYFDFTSDRVIMK